MRICVLSSGSKGNCTYIETKNHKVLIDIGTNCLYVEKALFKIGIEAKDIDSIFITHSHVDHISGLKVFEKKYKPVIYTTKNIFEEIGLNLDNVYYIENELEIEDLKITIIKTSHDVSSVGYILESLDKSVVYITDTGYIKEKYYPVLSNRSIYIFESNHDVEKLMNNEKYPHHIKIRILSDKGHLSNKDSARCLSKLYGPNTQKIILAHLSDDNNTPDLALTALKEEFSKRNIEFEDILIAKQKEQMELIEI